MLSHCVGIGRIQSSFLSGVKEANFLIDSRLQYLVGFSEIIAQLSEDVVVADPCPKK